MSAFVYLIRNSDPATLAGSGPPTQARQVMQKWLDWMRELDRGGHLKDPGQPLARAGSVIRGADHIITDGPYAETKDVIGGYLVVEAADLQEAVEMAKGCPILARGGAVEVRAVAQVEA